MDPAIAPSVTLCAVNDRLFEEALKGLSREQLLMSPSEAANPILWIAGHVANTRFGLSDAGQEASPPVERALEVLRRPDGRQGGRRGTKGNATSSPPLHWGWRFVR